jgi:hypothetical protein
MPSTFITVIADQPRLLGLIAVNCPPSLVSERARRDTDDEGDTRARARRRARGYRE